MKTTLKQILILFSILLILITALYFWAIVRINKITYVDFKDSNGISLRKFPFPYKAGLAICNDIDGTDTVDEFLEIQEYLNTEKNTKMGRGVGLEIASGFFMKDGDSKNRFSYYSANPSDRLIIQNFIRTGYLDFFHSYGEGYAGREDALKALFELKEYRGILKVWVNHGGGSTTSNIGNRLAKNLGDVKDSQFYHADVSIEYGVKYVELGTETNIIGQGTPVTLDMFVRSIDSDYFLKSAFYVTKTFFKNILAVCSIQSATYHMHANNDLINITTLDDGQKIYEFIRLDNHPDGIGKGATSQGTAYNISDRLLRTLKQAHGYAIIYTHLGKNSDCSAVIAEETQAALKHLKKEYEYGEIYVTTTSKLLNFYLNYKYLVWSSIKNGYEIAIHIKYVDDPVFGKYVPSAENLQGITFYTPANNTIRVFIEDREIPNIIKNPIDEKNRESVSIPKTFLTYPNIDKTELIPEL
jgi:hypothetical protein